MRKPRTWYEPNHGNDTVGWRQAWGGGGVLIPITGPHEFARARIDKLVADMNALCDQAVADIRAHRPKDGLADAEPWD